MDGIMIGRDRQDVRPDVKEKEQMMGYDFTGKPASQVNGMYVRVVKSSGIRVEGRLTGNGRIGGLQVLDWNPDGDDGPVVAGLSDQVTSVERIWDCRCWSPVAVKNAREGDAIVVNGRTYPVCRVDDSDAERFREGRVFKSRMETLDGKYAGISFPSAAVDCALRLNMSATSPTDGKGIYKGSDGNLWIRDCYGTIVKIEVAGQSYRTVSTDGVISPDAYPFVKVTDDEQDVEKHDTNDHDDDTVDYGQQWDFIK